MRKTRRVSTTEFKQECVNLVVNQGYTILQAANAMHVSLSSMQRWASQYRQEITGITPLAKAFTPEQQRIQVLESEIKQLRRDNDLLKKLQPSFRHEQSALADIFCGGDLYGLAIEMQANNKSSRSN